MESPGGSAMYSISLRLRRTTVEYAYVSVPVDDAIVRPDESGVGRIDAERMTAVAVQFGGRPEVVWYPEDRDIVPHPMQKAPEPGEDRYSPPAQP